MYNDPGVIRSRLVIADRGHDRQQREASGEDVIKRHRNEPLFLVAKSCWTRRAAVGVVRA